MAEPLIREDDYYNLCDAAWGQVPDDVLGILDEVLARSEDGEGTTEAIWTALDACITTASTDCALAILRRFDWLDLNDPPSVIHAPAAKDYPGLFASLLEGWDTVEGEEDGLPGHAARQGMLKAFVVTLISHGWSSASVPRKYRRCEVFQALAGIPIIMGWTIKLMEGWG